MLCAWAGGSWQEQSAASGGEQQESAGGRERGFILDHRDGKKETVLVTEESVWQFSSPK